MVRYYIQTLLDQSSIPNIKRLYGNYNGQSKMGK